MDPVVSVLSRVLESLTIFFGGKGVDLGLGCRGVVDVSRRMQRVDLFGGKGVGVWRGRCRCWRRRFDERWIAVLCWPECCRLIGRLQGLGDGSNQVEEDIERCCVRVGCLEAGRQQ
jgi:hypothetical protein